MPLCPASPSPLKPLLAVPPSGLNAPAHWGGVPARPRGFLPENSPASLDRGPVGPPATSFPPLVGHRAPSPSRRALSAMAPRIQRGLQLVDAFSGDPIKRHALQDLNLWRRE